MPTLNLSNKMCMCLSEMEYGGLAIDEAKLDYVEFNYRIEKKELIRRLQELVHSYMGDTPINLSSPEQVSSMIFSYIPKDKKAHAIMYQLDSTFRPRIKTDKFRRLVRSGCKKVMKTTASVCKTCNGTGKVRKIKKDGTPFSRPHTCHDCGGAGMKYMETGEVGGLKIFPPDSTWVTANGFSTDKNRLRVLAKQLRS